MRRSPASSNLSRHHPLLQTQSIYMHGTSTFSIKYRPTASFKSTTHKQGEEHQQYFSFGNIWP